MSAASQMTEQSDSKEREAKEVRRCGKPIAFEGNAICVVPIPDGAEDHFGVSCTPDRWWCTSHDAMRIHPGQPCPKCYSESIAKLEQAMSVLDERYSDAEHLSSDVEDLQSDIKDLRGIVSSEAKKRRELSGRLRQDERDDVLADHYHRSSDLGSLLRLLLQPQIILSGYAAVMSGGTPTEWMLDALGDCKRERLAQVRGEYQAARELLGTLFQLVKLWKTRKPVQ